MERKISKNNGELIVIAGNNMFPTFWKGLFATFLGVLPFLALTAGMFAIDQVWAYAVFSIIMVVLIGPIQKGYFTYMRELYEGANPSLKRLFTGFYGKYFFSVYLGSAALVVLYAASFTLLILPGIFVVAFFAMVPYFVSENEEKGTVENMKTCFVRMRRNRVTMMSYKFLFYLIFLMITILGVFAFLGIYAVSSYSMVLAVVMGIVIGLTLLFMLCVFVSFYHSLNYVFYLEIQERYSRKINGKNFIVKEEVEKDVENDLKEDEIKVVEVNLDDEKVEEPKKVAPKATKKTATKSTSATKTTAKKSTKTTDLK